MAIDGGLVVGLLLMLAHSRPGELDPLYSVPAVVSLLLMVIFYSYFGVYHFFADRYATVMRLTKAWWMVVFTLLLVAFVTKASAQFSREVALLWVSGAYCLQLIAHLLVPILLRLANLHHHRVKAHAVIVGGGTLGLYLAQRINNNPWNHNLVIGVVDDDELALRRWVLEGVPVLGTSKELPSLIDAHKIEAVYLALPLSMAPSLERIYAALAEKCVDVYWAPDIFRLSPVNLSLKELGGVPLIALSETPLLGSHRLAKAFEDRLLAFLILLCLSPLMLVVALCIRIDSPGPMLFKQKRHGWNGKIIEVWKFRTMFASQSPEDRIKQATRDDRRITGIGRYLRRSSIDELPQLFNVLQGTMSLVGPRPHAVEHNEYYAKEIGWYMTRHRIKPGITGLAQVEGCRGQTDTVDKMARRVDLDLHYINNWSIGLDLWILVRTVFALRHDNAY
jgi:putative colanic acid biosynthesis UDP-glucose lipid carrier transferase